MIFGILVMITALSISAVAIYYSVSGLVAIFAAAAVPIMIMGGVLEVGKLVTAVWLHRYWHQSNWWLKSYLSVATLVLMFITSMGIFGFLSKAHIEQTAAAQEGVAQIQRIETEIARQQALIVRTEERILTVEASVGAGNEAIQEQIDREQERIDNAYIRIQPAIEEQTAIIEAARAADAKRTEPYEQQLTNLQVELERLDAQATQYEQRIAEIRVDASAVDPLLAQIANIESSIVRVEGQLASGEREQVRQAQSTIGSNPDGNAGPNTRRSANAWIQQQRERIAQLQSQISDLRTQAQSTVDTERQRLAGLVASIRGEQTEAIKARQLSVLNTIDSVRATESPAITAARDEIARIRAGADTQIAQSNTLIQSLRDSLTIGADEDVEAEIMRQQQTLAEANNIIDTLTEQKYTLQAEYRKLEAEVGPVKYLAEFVYGETANQDLLEEAVRWVIITIIFVFDPLAVLLLIASQATFEMRRQERLRLEPAKENNHDNITRPDDGRDDWKVRYARSYTNGNVGDISKVQSTSDDSETTTEYGSHIGTSNDGRVLPQGILGVREEARRLELISKEQNESYQSAKQKWKTDNPDKTIKQQKDRYIHGTIDKLPWEEDEE